MNMKIKSIMKKSLRSLTRNKGSYIACIIVMALGMSVFIAMLSILSQIDDGINRYYDQYRFGEAFAVVQAMPENNLKRLESIEGIQAAEGSLTQVVRVTTDTNEIVSVKLVGVDPSRERKVNGYNHTGEDLSYPTDIWLGAAFMNARGLNQGDTIRLQISGKEIDFTLRGAVASPEYITIVPENAIIPDESTYTIGYVDQDALGSYLSMTSTVTELGFLLEEGYVFSDVEWALENALSKYGLSSLVEREDHLGHSYLQQEIEEMTILGTVLPAVFLIITFIMIFIMLKRVIEQERGEIGTFKAFGFRSHEILSGYLLHGVVTGGLGFLLGVLVCFPFGNMMYQSYATMFSLPDPSFTISQTACLMGLAMALLVSTSAVLAGALSVITIHPAEAMRPKSPKIGRSRINFNSRLINLIFNKTGVLGLRNIMRDKMRSGLVIISIVFSFAAINVIYAMGQAAEDIIMTHPLRVELYNIRAELDSLQPSNSLMRAVSRIEGVTEAEPLLNVGAELIKDNKKLTAQICGVSVPSSFLLIEDGSGTRYDAPENGLIINTYIAGELGVRQGDLIEIKSPYLRDSEMVKVTEVVEEVIGAGCYMEIASLSHMFFGGGTLASTAMIRAEDSMVDAVAADLTDYPRISDIVSQERKMEVYAQMMESFMVMIYCLIFMAFLMGFGAIYNVSRISLEEKKRHLCTMRILGYRVDETADMNSFEQWILLAVGIVLGFPPAFLLKDYLSSLFTNERYIMVTHLTLESTLLAVLACSLALILSNQAAKRNIRKFDLADVLRERE